MKIFKLFALMVCVAMAGCMAACSRQDLDSAALQARECAAVISYIGPASKSGERGVAFVDPILIGAPIIRDRPVDTGSSNIHYDVFDSHVRDDGSTRQAGDNRQHRSSFLTLAIDKWRLRALDRESRRREHLAMGPNDCSRAFRAAGFPPAPDSAERTRLALSDLRGLSVTQYARPILLDHGWAGFSSLTRWCGRTPFDAPRTKVLRNRTDGGPTVVQWDGRQWGYVWSYASTLELVYGPPTDACAV
jgi:hypothetical protein